MAHAMGFLPQIGVGYSWANFSLCLSYHGPHFLGLKSNEVGPACFSVYYIIPQFEAQWSWASLLLVF
jgi:hypothetical protein